MIVHSLCLHPGIISVTRIIHVPSVHLRPQTNNNKLSDTTKKMESVRFFRSLQDICPYRVFNSLFHFLLHDNPSITVCFHFTSTFSSFLQLWVTCVVQEAIARDTELTTKCSWLKSLCSCFSSFALSSGDFCKEFKASSPNSRFRAALVFSPGSTIPLEKESQNKKMSIPIPLAFPSLCLTLSILHPPAPYSGHRSNFTYSCKLTLQNVQQIQLCLC